MKRKFSYEELYYVRTTIPIEKVIRGMRIPHKKVEGIVRFLCPQCDEFRAAVLTRKNLSRCFTCNKNFNTLELVMTERNLSFVESVNLLMKHFPQGSKVTNDNVDTTLDKKPLEELIH